VPATPAPIPEVAEPELGDAFEVDPQDCPDCLAAADICRYHTGWADGWAAAASVVAAHIAVAQAEETVPWL
jgi:hypothetical protein